MERLSKPVGALGSFYEAVVVGSGYGGGVAASRLARMGLKVAVLERGNEMHPGEYPDSPDKAIQQTQIHTGGCQSGSGDELFDLRVGEDINVLVGCGLGGTSLINANVSIEPDPRLFADDCWPSHYPDADLQEGYDRARKMLRPTPYPHEQSGWPSLNKTAALERSATALGAPLKHPDLNVTFEEGHNAAGVWQAACNLCGDCCSGCNVGAKNTVLMNYLPDAAAFGAEIFCGVAVRSLRRAEDGTWVLRLELVGFGHDRFENALLEVRAGIVILAAGTLGSTEILLRSQDEGLALSQTLGSKFSGNGDVLAFGYNNDVPIDGIGLGWQAADYDWRSSPIRPVGPTIIGLIDLRDTDDPEKGMIIEEGAIPGGLSTFLPAALALGGRLAGRDTDEGDILAERGREIESLTRGPYHGAVNHTQTFLIMSHDDADGRLLLDGGKLSVVWPGVGEKPGFTRVAEKVRAAVTATGGTYVPNPLWSKVLGHHLVTVHPLGGCPMADDGAKGVVDGDCRVFSGSAGTQVHEGLYVCDGSVLPRSLGVNPLLTISAIAERAMIRLAARLNKEIDLTPAPKQPSRPRTQERAVGLRFTERMAGNLHAADNQGEVPASFTATIVAEDLDAFLADKQREARLVGTVSIPPISSEPLTIQSGTWNLFIEDREQVETKRMVYHMHVIAPDGSRLVVSGNKFVHDDKGFDLWRDTTTLHTEVRRGEDGTGELLFKGTLHIDPIDLTRQLRTMTVTGAPNFTTRMKAMARFGRLFAGELFDTFGGPLVRPSLFDQNAIRVKRPLRVGAPEIHYFDTKDGKRLRLTRYKGGTKGPLMFAHGLGVSSMIFSIDTIDTSLLEYLYAAGYDCWLLDYRASIALPYVSEAFTADEVAEYDFPAAVGHILALTGAHSVQVLAHCYGAMSFTMAMLSGLKNVRSAVLSQISAHADVPWWPQRILAWMRAPDLMALVGTRHLDARAGKDRDRPSRWIDALLAIYPFRARDRTRSATGRRITALYGPLYEIDRLNQATMDAMPEIFGKANIAAFRQLSKIARAGEIVKAGAGEPYLREAGLRNFAIPALFVHGERNGAFQASGTARTMDLLARTNGKDLYDRHVVPGAGHLDCIFGKTAVRDVYPHILAHLEKTARNVDP
jgi:cholesterol oxidase